MLLGYDVFAPPELKIWFTTITVLVIFLCWLDAKDRT